MCRIFHCCCNLYGIYKIINLTMKEVKEEYLMKLGIGVLKPDHLVPPNLANPTNLPMGQITIITTFPNAQCLIQYCYLIEVEDTIALPEGSNREVQIFLH